MERMHTGAGESWVCVLCCSMSVHVSCGSVFLVGETSLVPSSSRDGSKWLAEGAQYFHIISNSHNTEFSYLSESIVYIFQTRSLSFLVEGEH